MPEIMYRWRCDGQFGCGAVGFAHSEVENAQAYADIHEADCVGETSIEVVEPLEVHA